MTDDELEIITSNWYEVKSALDSLAFAAPEMYGLHLSRIDIAADEALKIIEAHS